MQHSLFWTFWVCSFTFIQSIGSTFPEWKGWLAYYIITLPIFIFHTYLIAYALLPVSFFKKRYLLFGGGVLFLLIVFSMVELMVSNELVFRYFAPEKYRIDHYLGLKEIIISGIGNHYIILVFLAIKAGRSWYSVVNQKEQLLLLKRETDLEIYRYQLQPQLVQSLMEDLEVMARSNPGDTPKVIVKISNFLNILLYEAKEDLIPLELEMKLMEEFMGIHSGALGQRLKSELIVNGSLRAFVVPPLLLLPFINQAIKLPYLCNESYESTVILKAERKYLMLLFRFWSEEPFQVQDGDSMSMTQQRLQYHYPDKSRFEETRDENFREIRIEIFY